MDLHIGERYLVEVTKLEPFGAIVRMEDDSSSLIHISNIANCFIKNVGDFVSVGQTFIAEGVEGKVKPVELSLKGLKLEYKNSVHSGRGNKKLDDTVDRHSNSFYSAKRYFNTPPKSTSTTSSHRSIDDMIDESNDRFEEKFGKNSLNNFRVCKIYTKSKDRHTRPASRRRK